MLVLHQREFTGKSWKDIQSEQTYLMASHPLEVAYGVTDGIHSHVAHVQAPGGVWKHGEDVKLLPAGTLREEKGVGGKKRSSKLDQAYETTITLQEPPPSGSRLDESCVEEPGWLWSLRSGRG